MQTNPTILIIARTSEGYARAVMRGVLGYARRNTDWECIQVPPPIGSVGCLKPFEPFAGVIAEAQSSAEVKILERLPVPVVIVTGAQRSSRVPQVIADNAAVGHLAFQHFHALGFEHYAFAGWPGAWFVNVRGQAFRDAARAMGGSVAATLPAPTGRRNRDQRILARWLGALPHRTAIFAADDRLGRDLILAARSIDLAVPEQVAVLGVDNDEMVCELTSPPLSSIDNATFQIGHQAAVLLQRLLAGRRSTSNPVVIPPVGVVTRQSTETLAVEQPRVVAVLRHIRQCACEGITIRDVLRHAPGSRRALERDFKRLLGRTLQQELTRVRMERARQLLRESTLQTTEIAMQVAVSSAAQFSVVFRRETGMTPTQYRARFGASR